MNKEHLYFPDFIINGNTYIEIKNYMTDIVKAKIDSFPKGLNYKILFGKDLKQCIQYCINKYGKQY